MPVSPAEASSAAVGSGPAVALDNKIVIFIITILIYTLRMTTKERINKVMP